MEENKLSQKEQEKVVISKIAKETIKSTPDEEKNSPQIVKETKTQKVIKNSTAITLTIIEIITTLFACGICLYLTFTTMTGNHAWSIILYFAFFAIFLGVGFIYALISNITILVLMLTGKKPKPKGVIISYIINCLTIFLYVPTIIIMVLAIQQVII